jgi:microcystin degradation protein MlrC
MKKLKLGIAGLSHETITFWPGIETLEDFEIHALHGEALVEERRGTETYEGGFLDICDEAGVDLFPVCETFGGARETVADSVYEFYVDEMRREFGKVAGELDGILMPLQGNIVTESLEEAESRIVREIRQVVGWDIPIMCAMDLHANISPELLDWADAICADQEMPHIDKREVGRRTARIMLATLRGEIEPTIAMSKPGIVVPSLFSNTNVSPGKDLKVRLREWEKHPGVVDVSVFYGFAWADVPQLGMTMVAVTNNNPALAEEVVEDLSDLALEKRRELTGEGKLLNVRNGVALAIYKAKGTSKPIIISHPSVRTGDTTHVLKELLKQDAENVAYLPMLDPEAAKDCMEAGAGNTVELEIGAKTGWSDGGPIKVKGEVLWAGERKYIGRGARSKQIGAFMWRKDQHEVYGPTAILRVDGVWLQLTAFKCSLVDEQPFTLFGFDPRDFSIIATPRAPTSYLELIEEEITVDAPGQCTADLSLLEWKKVPPGVYPITSDLPIRRGYTWRRGEAGR